MITFDQVSKAYPTPKGVRTILKDVSFTLEKSCKLGILGVNGAGKSTLINLMSGAQQPSAGRITRGGRLSWPLGFAGGFNGSLSGLENCLFVARIYGRNEKEVAAYVADFSELGDHFYLPVKSYSSGMRARLSFGLSLAFDFDYYLIDEVIAVGDARFRAKCQVALQDIHARAGVILVSHSPELLKEHCSQIAVVHDKKVRLFPDYNEGWAFYKSILGKGVTGPALPGSAIPVDDISNMMVNDAAAFA